MTTLNPTDNCSGVAAPAPLVSIIVPARDEEVSIGDCLMSLRRQDEVSAEIIMVDDGSADRTHAIAEFIAGVRVIHAGPLPAGWIGKNYACHVGARAARGKWLLFTDADTHHKPGSLARALAEANAHGASLLSYSPEQIVFGFAQRTVMSLVFAELAETYRPAEVSDPAAPAAAANGQYLLITREAYEAVGGYAAIASELLDDVELARAVKRSGRKLFFRNGHDAVSTRMYRSWPHMREGWTKNLSLLFPDAEKLAARRSLEFAASVGALGVAAIAAMTGRKKLALAAAAIGGLTSTNLLRRVRKAHFDPLSTALAPLGLPLFAYLLSRSRICHKEGRVEWKGREYRRKERERMVPESPAARQTKIGEVPDRDEPRKACGAGGSSCASAKD
jgi:cellulose synthase/poly-beta-1,6-N-acetylglucosamine synthase-like glycosyltransferase